MQSPRVNPVATTMVSDLIDRDLGGWNIGLIDTIFLADEVAVIRKITLSHYSLTIS